MKTKRCPKCRLEKKTTEFSKSKRNKNGLQSWCKPCMNIARAKWNAENPEKRKAANRSWGERNPEKIREKSLAWRNRNIERARANSLRWKKNNAERNARNEQKRRAIRAGVEQGYFPTLSELIVIYGDRCMYPDCNNKDLTIDHVVPLALGGIHDISNVQILCGFHNSQKGNRSAADYRD